ncbi:MAG: HVO_2922 family protein [Halobacteriales archaeon]
MADLTFVVYQDRADQWRWRLVHANGNIIADSGQGYTSKQNAINGIETVKGHAEDAPVEEHSIEELDDPPAE